MASGITKRQIHGSIAVIHPSLYLDRIEARLKTDGASIIDVLFDIALSDKNAAELRLKAIGKIADLSGAQAYVAALAAAAAKAAVAISQPGTEDEKVVDSSDPSTLGDEDRSHLKGLLDGAQAPEVEAGQPAPAAPEPVEVGRRPARTRKGARPR